MTTENQNGQAERQITINNYLDYNFLQVERALIRINKNNIYIKTPNGRKKVKLNIATIGVYEIMTDHANKTDYQPYSSTAISTLCRESGFSANTVRKHLEILEEVGLVEKEKRFGDTDKYNIKSLKFSNILYDRLDTNGEYVHQEIINYIKVVKEEQRNHLKRIDPFVQTIIETFADTEAGITQDEHDQLKVIIDSGVFSRGEIIDIADLNKEKSVPEFIQIISGEKDRRERTTDIQSLFEGRYNTQRNGESPY